MEQYSRMDPYSRSRYEQGIDSKIVIMGNSGVGKTSLLQRYTQNKFDPKNTTSTSGAFFCYEEGVRQRSQGAAAIVGHGGPGALPEHGASSHFVSIPNLPALTLPVQAPMYYRGANAALLLYDITNASTFDDIRGWLEELKKNCAPELIIYIVGSKADLSPYRQVTSDLARLSLHNWFPPPRPPTPPPPPTQQLSTLSYIRPRFTSFPGLARAPPVNVPPARTSTPTQETPAYLDLENNVTVPQPPSSRPSAVRQQSRFGSHFGVQAGGGGGWAELHDSSSPSNSLNEDDEIAVEDAEG
ncbi:hypothetical protein MVEN_01275600 [Mycena venus]|uniref:P-loop containing nucleoside triphosphate hydrolase protein n=1 Tax=Mycena venus TaxID=2733690 RepID=A0A8H6Y722_9AGAR|nr:hypothetical protein MVEN_01275600 [Mycena venus]